MITDPTNNVNQIVVPCLIGDVNLTRHFEISKCVCAFPEIRPPGTRAYSLVTIYRNLNISI